MKHCVQHGLAEWGHAGVMRTAQEHTDQQLVRHCIGDGGSVELPSSSFGSEASAGGDAS